MTRMNFALLIAVFVLLSGIVSAYTHSGGNCICNSCTDCTNALDDDTNCSLKATLNQSISSNDLSCIDDPANWDNNKILDLDGYTIYATTAQPQRGIFVADQGHIEIRNGEVADFHFFGILLLNVTYATIHDITVTGNGASGAGAGIYLGTDTESQIYNSYSTIYDCEVVDNDATGIMIQFADDNDIYRCDISRNLHGLWLYASSDNYVRDCFSDDNTGALGTGFSCSADHAFNHGSVDNTLRRVNASGNFFGAFAENCVNGNFDDVILSDNFYGAFVAFTNDHLISNPHAVTIQNSDVFDNYVGIWVNDSANNGVSGCVFEDNVITSNTYGVYLSNTYDNTIRRNDVSSGLIGISLLDSGLTSLPTNTVHGNSWYGLAIMNSSATSGTYNRFYNNSPDFWATANSRAITLELWYTIFSMPTGSMSSSYTNLTVIDTLQAGYDYTINWTPTRAVPADTFSFGGKFINISGTALSIDNATWHWSDSELSGFIESRLELWKYSGSTWSVVNPTPNMGTNSISLLNFNPSSDYAILLNRSECPVITSPGTYQLAANLVGAPNSAAPLSGTVCVLINSSNVDLDCQGFTITNNGTAGTTRGVIANGYNNVTLRNCAGISDYTEGVFFWNSDNSRITNTIAHDNGDGILVNSCSYFNMTNNTAYSNDDDGFSVYGGSTYVNLSGSSAYLNGENGFSFVVISNCAIINNTADDNGLDGFLLTYNIASYNSLTRNVASNNGRHGFSLERANLETLSHNRAYGNAGDGIRFLLADNSSLVNNTVYRNTGNGLYFQNSNNNTVANTTAYSNSLYGFVINRSNINNLTNCRAYNDTIGGFRAMTDGTTRTFYANNLTLDNPAGNFQNYTSLDISDLMAANSEYTINWTANHYALPGTSASFRQKFVDINTVTGTVSIDTIVWRWLASEETGYTPAFFRLMKYNSSSQWQLMNGSPNTGARTLSLYSMNPASEYGILQFVVNTSILKLDQTILQASPGGIVQFNITVNNTGNITLDSATVRDRLPAGLTVAGAYPAGVCGTTTCTWTLGPLSPAASRVLYLNATVDYGVVDNVTRMANLTNYVNVTATSNLSGDIFQQDYENATIYYANVSAVKANIYPLPPSPGGVVVYQIDIVNMGEVNLSTVSVVDTLPENFTFAWSDTPSDVAGSVVNWTIGPIAPAATVTILMNATVNAGSGNGTYTNHVDVDAQPVNGDNVTASADAVVGVWVPAINVVKVSSAPYVTLGQEFTFNLTITNTGQINITIYAQDFLPAKLEFGGEADPAPTWSNASMILWDEVAINLTPGDSYNITYNVTTVGSGTGITNNVTVTGVPPNGDNVTANASVTLIVRNPPDDDGGEEFECITGSDCSPCEVCNDHACMLPEGSCNTVKDCKSGSTWVDDVLVPVDLFLCEECSCIPVDCIEDADCTGEGETCVENECVPPECTQDSDCTGPGEVCVGYECQPPECTHDSDCSDGYECVDYQCQEEGGGEPPYGQECTSDADCPGSQYCSGGTCTNVPCECGYASGHSCVPYECCSDADCPSGQSCTSHVCKKEVEVQGEGLEVGTPDTAQVGQTIVINVTDEEGNPVPGAQVTVIINGKAYSAGITDANGQVRFTPKEAGQYVVEASKPGFADGQDAFKASGGLDMAQIAILVLAPLLLLGLLAALYILFFAKKKKRKFKEDSED